jgi:N-acetylglucosaminyldiphosphoundecaprenol N-acetyl-beta-D-mannosaminyltransferase
MTRTLSPRQRLRIGTLWVDALSFAEALSEIERLVDSGQGGSVFTPNVDHVVKAESNEGFRRAYEHASLSLADGMPLVWAARLLGCPLPGRVAGADLLVPLMELAGTRGWGVYFLGGAPGVAEAAARLMADRYGIRVAGWDAPVIRSDGSDLAGDSVALASAASANIVLVALGPPKQEIWIHRATESLRPAVALGIGAGLDFLIGRYKRAPRWVSAAGLEWVFRLTQEPRRLWRRYLVDDPQFASVVLRTWRSPRSGRIREHPPSSRG